MQKQIIAGDSLNFLSAPLGFSAADGWALSYLLVPRAGGEKIEIDASAEGDAFRVAASSSVTRGWAPGVYSWSAFVSQAGSRQTVETGTITVLPDPAQVSVLDNRSQARRALDDLMEARATWSATNGRVASYSIAGRSMTYRSAAEIDLEIGFWRKQLGEEQISADLEAGLRPKNRILTRFSKPS